jgi:hypothetical protein
LNKLLALKDSPVARTKILATTVTADIAENIVNAGVMKPGDVIIYSLLNGKVMEHHHSVVYMGSAKIAMHTWANHPDHPTIHGDWKKSATDDHPLVTLIHFGSDDLAIADDSDMLGWWDVTWMGQAYFYLFEKNGKVAWTQKAPASLTQPMSQAGGRGYWFEEAHQITICWTETGSLEVLAVKPPQLATHLEGQWNNTVPLVADNRVDRPGVTR